MPLIEESQAYIRGGTQKDRYAPEEVIVVPCPLCGSHERSRVATEHGSIGISRCLSCSLLYASPRLPAPEQVYWGDGELYEAEAQLIFEGKAPHHRDPNYLEELRLIRRYKPHGRFLDVGCNMGMLLRQARGMGWTTVGVEPSPSLSKLATERLDLKVYNCFLHELPENEAHSFDVVALSDVFEHIGNPVAFLKDAGRFLAQDGLLYVKVPNGRWNLFKQRALALMGKKPAQGVWDSYEHVVHYTDKTLVRMLEQAGFSVTHLTIGMPIQTPVWHQRVGHYYQYPSPWFLDWKRQTVRSICYGLSWPERILRGGSIGCLAPNIVALAKSHSPG